MSRGRNTNKKQKTYEISCCIALPGGGGGGGGSHVLYRLRENMQNILSDATRP